MIVAELAGGLGNQMFQYAAARTVADRLGADLGLDVRTCRAADTRSYALGPYPIRARIVHDDELRGLHAGRTWRWALTAGVAERLGMVIRPSPFAHFARIIEPHHAYSDVLERTDDNSWMAGYWQSERYFGDAAGRIRADLAVQGISGEAAVLERRIRAMEYPVAVHVRRGDYAQVASTRAYHGLCGAGYYQTAMQRMTEGHPERQFVFFSDDPGWVRENLGAGLDLLVDLHGGARPHEDLHLMTRCRAHIIANSTFSWWGAWLADSRRVIAPVRWFQGGPQAPDIVPARWERL